MQTEQTINASSAETKPEDTTAAKPADKAGEVKAIGWKAVLIISLISSITSLAAYDSFFAQKIVAVDIKGYVDEQRVLYAAGKLTDDDVRKNMDRLEAVVKAIPSNKVVVMGDAVVRNVDVVKVK